MTYNPQSIKLQALLWLSRVSVELFYFPLPPGSCAVPQEVRKSNMGFVQLLRMTHALTWGLSLSGKGGAPGPGRGDKQVFVQGFAHSVCALTSYQCLQLHRVYCGHTHTPGKVTPFSLFLEG